MLGLPKQPMGVVESSRYGAGALRGHPFRRSGWLWRFLPPTHETLCGWIELERPWWIATKLLFTCSVITAIVMTLIGLSRSGAFG